MAINPDMLLSAEHPKTLGAYYTDVQVADFLVAWAIRDSAGGQEVTLALIERMV